MKRTSLATALGLALISSTASAASFDCTKASKPVEKRICADAQLSALDSQMAALYQALSKSVSGDDLARLKDDQRAWLSERGAGNDSKWLHTSYVARIAALKAKQAALARGPDWPFGEFLDAHTIQMYGDSGWRQEYTSDSYLLRKLDAKTVYFEISMTGNNAHQCSGAGRAKLVAPNTYVWTGTSSDDGDGDGAADGGAAPSGKDVCTVRITFLKDRVHLEPSGDGCRADCGADMGLDEVELFPIQKSKSAADVARAKE